MNRIISKDTVKRKLQEYNMRTSVDFYPELNNKVMKIVEESIKRAQANARTTVMARDL